MMRSDPLDCLKILAATMIFILHMKILDGFDPSNEQFYFMMPAWAGVWIFFIISGYLSEKGFFDERYTYTLKGIAQYYISRFIKVIIPTYVFISICIILTYPNFILDNNQVILSFLTLTYNGIPGTDGIGATWYVFTIFWLYILAPFLSFAIKKIKTTKIITIFILLITVIIIGCLIRLYLGNEEDTNWYLDVYTNPFINIDLFTAGMMAYLIQKKLAISSRWHSSPIKILSLCMLFSMIIINSYIYWAGEYQGQSHLMWIYQYLFPTIWGVTVLVIIISFKNSDKRVKGITRKIADLSFSFYLFHSLIGHQLQTILTISDPLLDHIISIVVVGIVTTVAAVLYQNSINPIVETINRKISNVIWPMNNNKIIEGRGGGNPNNYN